MTAGFGGSCLQVGAPATLLLSGAPWNLSSGWIRCIGHPRVVTLLPTAVWVHTGPSAHRAHTAPLSNSPAWPGASLALAILCFSNPIYELALVALVDDVLNFAAILSLHGLKGKHTDRQQCLAQRPGHRCFSSAFPPALARRRHTLLHPLLRGELWEVGSFTQPCGYCVLSAPMAEDKKNIRSQLPREGDLHLNPPTLGKEQNGTIKRVAR